MPKPADFPFSDDKSTAEAVYLTEIERKFLESLRKFDCDHWTPDFYEVSSAAYAGIIMASGIKHGSEPLRILRTMLPSLLDGLGLDPEETTVEDVIAKTVTVEDVIAKLFPDDPGMN